MMTEDYRYPPIDHRVSGMLDVGDGNAIHWLEFGSPAGKPALAVHGGPGSGTGNSWRRSFDPDRYRWFGFDQRGCGLSRPHASDPATDMSVNTTQHLIDDMERLREHFGVEKWLLMGGSWASTLILAYAEQHPERVSEIILMGVTMTRRWEINWLDWGVRQYIPAAFERFHAVAPEAANGIEMAAAFNRLMEDPDPAVRARAAADWCAWEDAVIAHETDGTPGSYSARVDDARLAFVRICTHYFSNAAFLEEGVLLQDAGKLAGIPGVLIHGRLDLGSPLQTAWDLAAAWPDAELVVVDSGHTGNDQMRIEIRRALDRFALH
jgi:proline iminopeptidase